MSHLSDHERLSPRTSGSEPDDGDATRSYAHAASHTEDPHAGEEHADTDATVISDQLPIEPVHSLASLRPRELGHLLEGRRLDHFQLEQFIGGGGMGAVFRARDTVLGRTVALKVLAAGAAGNDETRQRFRNEAQSAARLDHPNIARVHYVGEDQGFNYIVFEFLQGRNVRDLVTEVGPLPVADALRFTLQIAEALAHAWQRDLVHRDIKPSNVLATPEGQVKLVDMGLARLRDVTAPKEDLTASGMTLGTFDYISPEQARDPRHADSRSDIYSLGCTLYFMLCGRPPFQGGTAVQKLLMHQSNEPPNPRELRSDLPAGVELLLKRMLAKSPDDRFQNPAELIAAVTTLADQLGIAVHPTTTVRLTVSGQPSHPLVAAVPWLVPAILLFVCVLVIDYVDRSASSEDFFFASSPPSKAEPPPANDEHEANPLVPEGPAPPDVPEGRAGVATTAADTDHVPNASGSDPVAVSREPAGRASPSVFQESSPANAAAASMGGFRVVPWLITVPRRVAEFFNLDGAREGLPPGVEQDVSSTLPRHPFVNVTRHTAHETLAEACRNAANGDTLEIQQDGELLLERGTLPLRIVGRNLTLRGAKGKRPVLRVITSSNSRSSGRPSVFKIEDGTIKMENLALELVPEFPRGVLGGWRLFELNDGAAVIMSGCRMDMQGAVVVEEMRDHDDFFVAVGDTSSIPAPASAPPREPVRVDLQNVVFRGGDSLVAVDGDTHVSLSVDNGLFVLRGHLYDGMQRLRSSLGASSLELNHVTADLGKGALRISDIATDAWTRVTIRDSILIGTPEGALVDHVVEKATRDAPLVWNGDGNVYDGWAFYFRQQAISGERLLIPTLSDWQIYWSSRNTFADQESSDEPGPWSGADRDKVAFERVPADYVADDSSPYTPPLLDGDDWSPGMIISERLPMAFGKPQGPASDAR